MPWKLLSEAQCPALADLERGDAYAVWAEATDYVDYVGASGESAEALAVIVELAADAPGCLATAQEWQVRTKRRGT